VYCTSAQQLFIIMDGSRTVVSYDDITLPYTSMEASTTQSAPPPHSQPSKKKGWNKRKQKQNSSAVETVQQSSSLQSAVTFGSKISVGDGAYEGQEEDEDEDEESRELTHGEIWDDTALIDAWNAASEEYESFHGPQKNWKTEPVHRSPL
jgi:hypothetical protein